MVTHTRYNNYPVAEQNERDWHEPYQLALTQIDEDVAGITQNRISKDSLSAVRSFKLPIYADLNNYPSPTDGNLSYVSGGGVLAEGVYSYDGANWNLLAGSTDSTTAQNLEDLGDVQEGTIANRPAAGTAGLWYFTTDQFGLYYDTGTEWRAIVLHPSQITEDLLPFDPLSQADLDAHISIPGAHHTRYNDDEARSAVEGFVDAASLSGASGAVGQVLVTDGQNAQWSTGSGTGGSFELATGTFTLTTGTYTDLIVAGVTTDETTQFDVSVAAASEDQATGEYAFNTEWGRTYDSATDTVGVNLVVTWDIDPGIDLDCVYTVTAA